MPEPASALARRLADRAEAVCRHYLSNGRRIGGYWQVGDVRNTPGCSMFVRLSGPESGPGAAGHWRDAGTGEHGDLLDVIRESCGLVDFHDVADEARRFLGLTQAPSTRPLRDSSASARRLFRLSQPIGGTLAETYLRNRDIAALPDAAALRFHPRCFYRADGPAPAQIWPAMIAAVTDLGGRTTGVQRTWLDRSGRGKAPVDTPRRALGALLSHAVRFGTADAVMAAGEGIETVLSLRCVLPAMPMAAALSAGNLAALELPGMLRRLYVARDRDSAGDGAFARLAGRAQADGIETIGLLPQLDDFNNDLRRLGLDSLRAWIRIQLAPEDVARFMRSAA